MIKLNSIVGYLNKELKVKSIKDESKNGLQVRASNEIDKVGLATDACMDVFEKARKLRCNLVIVHHGMFWKGSKELPKMLSKKVNFLKKNRISLYAAHLPLDKHLKCGNNSNILISLGVKPERLFDEVGYLGHLKKYRTVDSISKEIEKKLDTKNKVWKFGKNRIRKIAVVSGYGGGSGVFEAIEKKVDLLVVGEASHGSYLRAKDGKLNMILAGHYKTETLGVKKVGQLLEQKFNIKTVFIDNPTGM
jgi:dinuclear metal center YbgI/SA1388 family protein